VPIPIPSRVSSFLASQIQDHNGPAIVVLDGVVHKRDVIIPQRDTHVADPPGIFMPTGYSRRLRPFKW